MRARCDTSTVSVIALLHLAAVIVHASRHVMAGVPNTPFQLVFIVLVFVIAPLVSAYVAWQIHVCTGAALLALSMLAALLFGYTFHFVIDSPDLCSHVVGRYQPLFYYSALCLALLELVGTLFGGYVYLCAPCRRITIG